MISQSVAKPVRMDRLCTDAEEVWSLHKYLFSFSKEGRGVTFGIPTKFCKTIMRSHSPLAHEPYCTFRLPQEVVDWLCRSYRR